ncbi:MULTISPECIES: ATP-binding protein [Sorangium]|uniref:ATP-binding protein n=1 Tax=Sorangium TaxID=39643 RepID=UPI003D9C1C9E
MTAILKNGLDRASLVEPPPRGPWLGSCQWVRAKQSVIVLGATGAGKSFLGGALAQAACRQGFRALVIRTPRVLQQLAVARADGTCANALARLAKARRWSSTTSCSRP